MTDELRALDVEFPDPADAPEPKPVPHSLSTDKDVICRRIRAEVPDRAGKYSGLRGVEVGCLIDFGHSNEQAYSTLQQTDLVPSLSLILGAPIPFRWE